MESNIWKTNKESVFNERTFGEWGNKSSTEEQVNISKPSEFKIDYVSKPMPIFSTIIQDHVELNKYLKEVILEHRQNNPTSTESNVKAWHSSWMTHNDNPKFQPLVDRVLDACNFVSKGFFQCQSTEYMMFNLWAMMYEESEHTLRHSHFPCDLSGCYYVDVEPDCAPIIFEPVLKDGVHDNNQPFIIQPKNGLLALWPGILHHEVKPTNSKRMCISFNMDKSRGYCSRDEWIKGEQNNG
tara:strand:- start:3258 stop:3977 length:720 start_codon:yes stop_codon:yes gene_type:complete